jgi:hypothetical protein
MAGPQGGGMMAGGQAGMQAAGGAPNMGGQAMGGMGGFGGGMGMRRPHPCDNCGSYEHWKANPRYRVAN